MQLKLKEENIFFILFFILEELIAVISYSDHMVVTIHISNQSFSSSYMLSIFINICLKNFNTNFLKKISSAVELV